MGKRTRKGRCGVCCEYGDLSFEHVPPQSCYNNRSVELLDGMKALNLAPGETRRGRIQQRGAGGYYSCGDCNSAATTYVRETIRWVERGAEVLGRIGDRDGQDTRPYARFADVVFFGVKPLLFLKQVVHMFLCINGPGFTARHPDLRAFVLNRYSTEMSDVCHFHIGLTWGPGARTVAGCAAGSLDTDGATYISDISFPPFSYAMWLGQPFGQLAPCEITHYKSYSASDLCDVPLTLQVGFTHLVLPSDYRSRAALELAVEENRKWSE